MPLPPLPPSTSKLKARALYDYKAADDTEISFTADSIIRITRNDDSIPGWLEGDIDGKRGLFPGNYVQILGQTELKKCVVLYDFDAENDDELTIKVLPFISFDNVNMLIRKVKRFR